MTSDAGLQDAHQAMLGIQLIRFSTGNLPERDRVAVWREMIGRNGVHLDLEPLSKRPLRSDVSVYLLPGLAMMIGEISDKRIARTRELVGVNRRSTSLSSGLRAILSLQGMIEPAGLTKGTEELRKSASDVIVATCPMVTSLFQREGPSLKSLH
jgi:hypothetical protein